jgi:tetratricopeptide (TPR) repeat protein
MTIRPLRTIACVAACAALLPARLAAQETLGLWAPNPGPLVAEIRAGIEDYYAFDYAGALARFDRVIAAVPDHPVGYFLKAEANWWLFLNDRQDAATRRELERWLGQAIARAEERLESHPDDVETLFILGSAYGRRGMLAGTARDAWSAARDAQRAKGKLDRVQELAPRNVDAVAAEGLYQYYVGTFGSVTRAASRLLFGLRGDRQAGLRALDAARRGGTYTRTEAGFFQGLFYLQYENRPAAAQPILDALRERYPQNLYFATMSAYARQRQRRFEAARPIYESVLRKLAGTGVYGREGESITRLFYGQTMMALGAYGVAEEQFVRVVQLRAAESDAYPHAYLFLGRLADLAGNREIAETYYRKVLTLSDAAGSREAAERYLDRPFAEAEIPALVGGPVQAR